jgi:hypothetical protein
MDLSKKCLKKMESGERQREEKRAIHSDRQTILTPGLCQR